MLFTSIVCAALAQSLTASAATMMVTVGANNQFTFTPNSVTAQPGDMVAFNFVTQNHSVASSNANTPCQPQRNAVFSDFQPVAAPASAASGRNGKGRKGKKNNKRQAGNTPMFMLPITDTNPMYIYCSQAQHCQQGMVMVINPPDANAVQKYQNKAARANNNVSPQGGISGGSVVNNAAGTNPPNGVLGANQPAGPAANGKGKGKGKGKAAGGVAGALAGLVGGKGKGNN
ncbi:hypothetical protein K458DRAFT_442941 [Lentithecium fluviatile CBS 122367]|uniref:Cupredoxin n=1 Tax=Lentithecium fluviatile CBS 122367 TaxID=1168545 RepID=A0A6G1J291_9PLEO|nr:hypothetical protein K458DRAFT_442941 [Lentithecium fluviatile CBS 122367]